jgi:hypothetical protein
LKTYGMTVFNVQGKIQTENSFLFLITNSLYSLPNRKGPKEKE